MAGRGSSIRRCATCAPANALQIRRWPSSTPRCARISTRCSSITAPRPACAWPASISAGTPRACRRRRSSGPRSIARPKPTRCAHCFPRSSCQPLNDRQPDMAVRTLKRSDLPSDQFSSAILDSLSEAVVVVDGTGLVRYANLSAEQFFGVGRARLVGHPLNEFIPEDTPLFSLLEQVTVTGAAQLLEQSVPDSDRELTNLICEETDRIVALVDRMEAFADGRPIERGPLNIHQVLNHVRRLSQNGFGKNVRFVESYDPSLPDVFGDRDQLIQVFLNLVKNACEAPGEGEREIELSTGYRHGLRLAVPGQQARVNLPLVVSVRDNGRGVSDEIRGHLFDAFVTNKPTRTGLGLALVAKIVNDHGGAIEYESEPGRTTFRVMLPLQAAQTSS